MKYKATYNISCSTDDGCGNVTPGVVKESAEFEAETLEEGLEKTIDKGAIMAIEYADSPHPGYSTTNLLALEDENHAIDFNRDDVRAKIMLKVYTKL